MVPLMFDMKILSIQMINFKGFERTEIDFENVQSVILGGKNGYGKTTIFDAIELALTGCIRRLQNYNVNHNKNYSFNQDIVPLANNSSALEVKVSVRVVVNEKHFTISCFSQTSEISNPIDFKSFKRDIICDEKQDSAEDEYNFLCNLKNNYNLLNYISQEDTTFFLKSKDAERSKIVSSFFNTDEIDSILEKVELANKVFKAKERNIDDQINNYKGEQEQLNTSEKRQGFNKYNKLCVDDQIWDQEDPKLSYEDYDGFLRKGGVFDLIQNFIKYQDEFNQWIINTSIEKILSHKDLNKLPLYFWGVQNHNKIQQLSIYQNIIKPKIKSFSIHNNKTDFLSDVKEKFNNVVKEEDCIEVQNNIRELQLTISSGNEIQMILTNLQSASQELKNIILKDASTISLSQCPTCGTKFNNHQELSNHVKNFNLVFEESNKKFQHLAEQSFNLIQEKIERKITKPIDELFNKDEFINIYDIYLKTDLSQIQNLLEDLQNFINIENFDVTNQDSLTSKIITALKAKIVRIPSDINYRELKPIYETYIKNINPLYLQESFIEEKRNYLAYCWSKKESERYKSLSQKIIALQKQKAFCTQQKKNLKKIKDSLTKKKIQHLKKVVSEIEILFYIYSGRIMQDNYYGRGLFMKYSPEQQRVLFVTDYNSDVDALYNLSSGQLVAVIFAFILSLNQLYSKINFLAIDDPIQSIDDINVWGLTETLRHSFNNHFLLLSTHEEQYASLIRYKFSKRGIDTSIIKMEEKHLEIN